MATKPASHTRSRDASGSPGHPGISARPRCGPPAAVQPHPRPAPRAPRLGRQRLRRELLPWAATYLEITVEVVKRPGGLHTSTVLPRRWVVERTLAWITSYRRCARDYERLPAHHEAAVYWAMITLMTRSLARPG
ncbi:MAG TPA: transposase [Streptosporangiaceae bacterium]|nr:transposase [Streptosporangiaceae bacterium]